MPTTTYKGYEIQTTGSNSGTWGAVLNDDMIAVADRNVGGIVTKSLSSSNVTLTDEESQNAIIRFTGTLSANVEVTTAARGFHIVENLTSGAFSVTLTDGVAGVVIPQGGRALVAMDATNGARIAADVFPSGTKMSFFQAAAPSGWTKDTTAAIDNAAIRIVTGTGGGTGGSVNFTTAFASQTPSGTISGTALTEAQLPAHFFYLFAGVDANTTTSPGAGNHAAVTNSYGSSNDYRKAEGATATAPTVARSSTVGSGSTHTHTFTGNAINMAVKYADFIVGIKA